MYPPYTLPFAKMYINNSEKLTPGVNQFPHVSSAETETHNHFCHKSAHPFDLPGFSRQKSDCLDHCFIFQGQFFHFRPIYRNREVEDDLPDPVTVQLLFREQFDPLNERPHELLPLHLGGGFIDLIKRKQQAVNVVARNFLLSDIPYLALHIVNLDFDLIYSTILLVIATLQIRNFPVIIRVIHIQTVHLPFQAGFCA